MIQANQVQSSEQLISTNLNEGNQNNLKVIPKTNNNKKNYKSLFQDDEDQKQIAQTKSIHGVGKVVSRFFNTQTTVWTEIQGSGCIISDKLVLAPLHFIFTQNDNQILLADQIYFVPQADHQTDRKPQRRIKVANKIFNHQYFSKVSNSAQKFDFVLLQLEDNSFITKDYVIRINYDFTLQKMKDSPIYITGYKVKPQKKSSQQFCQQNSVARQKQQFFKYKFSVQSGNSAGPILIKNSNSNQFQFIGLHIGQKAKNNYFLLFTQALKYSKHIFGSIIQRLNLYEQLKPLCESWHVLIKEQNIEMKKGKTQINGDLQRNYQRVQQELNKCFQKINYLQKQLQLKQPVMNMLENQNQLYLNELSNKKIENQYVSKQVQIHQDKAVSQYYQAKNRMNAMREYENDHMYHHHHHNQQNFINNSVTPANKPLLLPSNNQTVVSQSIQSKVINSTNLGKKRFTSNQKYQMLITAIQDKINHNKIKDYMHQRYHTNSHKVRQFYLMNSDFQSHNLDPIDWWKSYHGVDLLPLGFTLQLSDHRIKVSTLLQIANFNHIQYLNLGGGYCHIDDYEWRKLIDNILRFPNLKILRLLNNQIRTVYYKDLQSFQSLQYIDFSKLNHNPLFIESTQQLKLFKQYHPHIKIHGKDDWIK